MTRALNARINNDPNELRFDSFERMDTEAEKVKNAGGTCKEDKANVGLFTFQFWNCSTHDGRNIVIAPSKKLIKEEIARLEAKKH